jgi:hypothetical protein
VVTALNTDTATRAATILAAPPAQGKYAALRAFLLETFELTDDERAERLLNMDLGDRKPTEAMDDILRLCGTHPPCFLIRHLFMRILPAAVRQNLVASRLTDLRELAREADLVHAAYKTQALPLNSVCTVGDDGSDECLGVAAVHHRRRQLPPRMQRKHASDRQLCYFHRLFGADARNCRGPCDWQGNGAVGLQKQ